MGTTVNNPTKSLQKQRDLSASANAANAWLQRLYAGLDAAGDVNEVLDHVLSGAPEAYAGTRLPPSDFAGMHQRMLAAEARIHELEVMLANANKLACEDGLTGSLNRRGLEDVLEREMARCVRKKSPLSIAMLDLDDFKRLNDTHGHSAGDKALVHLVQVIKETLRATDVIGRFGGEEFVVVLTDTPLEEAAQTISRVQRELSRRVLMHNGAPLPIHFSAGVTQCTPEDDVTALIARTDAALYQAKRAGKNRVESLA
jgi:diguanylate cyclase